MITMNGTPAEGESKSDDKIETNPRIRRFHTVTIAFIIAVGTFRSSVAMKFPIDTRMRITLSTSEEDILVRTGF